MIKIERSFPAPASLAIEAKKVNGSYSEPDVIERLYKDFHGKCYICELNDIPDPQVEHLLPHRNGKYPARKFDWENLFWVCPHCNNIKNQVKYDAGILDCCKKDPEKFIAFELRGDKVFVRTKDSQNQEAILTAQLVDETFNLQNTGIRTCASKIRIEKLQLEMNLLYTKLQEYQEKPDSVLLRKTLGALLKRKSAFAAFKRNYIRKHEREYPELQKYLT